MSYISYDRNTLSYPGRALPLEFLLTNRAGTYCASSVTCCNTRKYHGLLVAPVTINGEEKNRVLLHSINETVSTGGRVFNLAAHCFPDRSPHPLIREGVFHRMIIHPQGLKYLTHFDGTLCPTLTYTIGQTQILKQILLLRDSTGVMVRYTVRQNKNIPGYGLPEKNEKEKIRLRLDPLLSFRDTDTLTFQNDTCNTSNITLPDGTGYCLYEGYPRLDFRLALSRSDGQVEFGQDPHWVKDLLYYKERERGYHYTEDALSPCSFTVSLSPGESVTLLCSAGDVRLPENLAPQGSSVRNAVPALWDCELKRRIPRTDLRSCLSEAAAQCYKRIGNDCYMLAGYPWYDTDARSEFFSLCDCTLGAGRPEYFETVMSTACRELSLYLSGLEGKPADGIIRLKGLDRHDALLWFCRCVQEAGDYFPMEEIARRYGSLCTRILELYTANRVPNVYLHSNGLLYVSRSARPAADICGDLSGASDRHGYMVEVNALWYNALRFVCQLSMNAGDNALRFDELAIKARESFNSVFSNGIYLNDYVTGGDNAFVSKEVRPYQLYGISLPFSPVDTACARGVLDICTRELLTVKGLRTLSPRSGKYRGVYVRRDDFTKGSYAAFNNGNTPKGEDVNYYNGPVSPLFRSAYARAYLRVYGDRSRDYLRSLLYGTENDVRELCTGTLNELYDGNAPYSGHGGMSCLCSISGVLGTLRIL